MNALTQYLKTMVDPTIEEFMRNPLSPRHAYIACVVTYHAIDRAKDKTEVANAVKFIYEQANAEA